MSNSFNKDFPEEFSSQKRIIVYELLTYTIFGRKRIKTEKNILAYVEFKDSGPRWVDAETLLPINNKKQIIIGWRKPAQELFLVWDHESQKLQFQESQKK